MKASALLLMSLLMAQNIFGQRLISDFDFKEPPNLKLENLDSVKLIKLYKAEQSGLNTKQIDWQGYMEIEVSLNEAQQMTSWRRYNDIASKVIEEFQFTYSGEKEIFIEQLVGQTPKRYLWYLCDTLIQEIKLVKGKKQKEIAIWKYEYMHDTLVSSIVKLDKMKEVEYKIQFEYSDSYKLTGQTVIKRDHPTTRLEADYDPEGHLIGYRFLDMKRNIQNQRVQLGRDSSDQIATVDHWSKRGDFEHWQREYNEKGLIYSSTRLNAEGEGLEKFDYEYDKNDKLTKRSKTINGVLKEQIDFVYDDNGNLTSKHYYKKTLGNMDLKYYFIWSYDEKNRLIRKDQWSKEYSMRMRLDYAYVSF